MIIPLRCLPALVILAIALSPALAQAPLGDCARLVVPYGDGDNPDDPLYSLALSAPDGGRLLYLGSLHTRDPEHPQFADFERQWQEFAPTVAFYEGNATSIGTSRDEAIEQGGEPGLVRFLADRDGVPAESLEPDRQDEIAFLLRTYSPEQVKLFYVLRVVVEMRDREGLSPSDLQREVPGELDRFGRYQGLASVMRDPRELEAAYRRHWTAPAHWWEAPAVWFDPRLPSSQTGGVFTNEVNQASSTFRNLHMCEVLARKVRGGERVFAVVGRDHVPMQAAALRCAVE